MSIECTRDEIPPKRIGLVLASKVRVDRELLARGLVESREKAQVLVMAGQVYADGQRVIKPATMVSPATELEVRGQACPYVSRGGWKLEAALDAFALSVAGWRCLDLGASTGGFTDLLLQRGADHVTAVDVGKGQLHWKLRNDARVEVREKTNARYLKPEDFSFPFDFLTGDLSFIGLELILPAAFALGGTEAQAVFLIKPQFEAGRHQVGKGGVVRDLAIHREVLLKVLRGTYGSKEIPPAGLIPSPIRGPAGNVEYLVHFRRPQEAETFDLEAAVERALEQVGSQSL